MTDPIRNNAAELDSLLADLRAYGAKREAAERARHAKYRRSIRGLLHHAAGYRSRPISVALTMLARLFPDCRAVTGLEYGIIAGVLGLLLIAIFKHFGTELAALFSTIGRSI